MSLLRRMLPALVVLGLLTLMGGSVAYSALTDTADNTGNSIESGTVKIDDDDADAPMFTLPSLQLGDTAERCINVTYTGSLPAAVRLHGTASGALANYMDLTVTRGTNSTPFSGCAGFSADATNYIGAGAGVVFSSKIHNYPAAPGSVDPIGGTAETWTNGETHAYRFTISVPNDSAAQGTSASATFAWEASNL